MAADESKLQSSARMPTLVSKELQDALDLATAHVLLDPISSIYRHDLIEVHERIGDWYAEAGADHAALAAFEEALGSCRKLLDLHKDQTGPQLKLSDLQVRIGDFRKVLGDEAAAMVAYGEAVSIRERMLSFFPESQRLRRDLAIAQWRLAEVDARNRKRLMISASTILQSQQKAGVLTDGDRWMVDAIKRQLDSTSTANCPKPAPASTGLWLKLKSLFS
jgi:tetratricopeptide (TPR) repeat protein